MPLCVHGMGWYANVLEVMALMRLVVTVFMFLFEQRPMNTTGTALNGVLKSVASSSVFAMSSAPYCSRSFPYDRLVVTDSCSEYSGMVLPTG